jgi:hypothetical protein
MNDNKSKNDKNAGSAPVHAPAQAPNQAPKAPAKDAQKNWSKK